MASASPGSPPRVRRYLIIGGVAGGASAAARLRRLDEHASITIVERSGYVSYANCGLPYYIGGSIARRDRLFLQTPESFRRRFRIEVLVHTEALRIDREACTVEVRDLTSGGVSALPYDALVLAPGAEPLRPKLPGIDDSAVFTFRNVEDTDRLRAFLDEGRARRAVVVGGGFIGLEMAENLRERGLDVALVEMLEQVLAPLDFELAAEVHAELRRHGVQLHLGRRVAGFRRGPEGLTVDIEGSPGQPPSLPADLVLLSLGVRPDSRLAREAGLAIGERGGIVVDSELRTSDPRIWAAGDAIEFAGITVPLAGPANRQGRIIAENIALGAGRAYRGAIATAIVKVFGLTAGATGCNERTLRREGTPFGVALVHAGSHAGYYPGASNVAVKVLFDPSDGRLLGGQVVGGEGADKRLDVIALALKMGGTVHDLAEFEHGYAPPYSSARDPVNVAGFVAENQLAGLLRTVAWHELADLERRGAVVLDVRTAGEVAAGTIPGALHVPVDELRERAGEVPRDRKVVVLCGVGLRAYLACRILAGRGFPDVADLAGGWRTWSTVAREKGWPIAGTPA